MCVHVYPSPPPPTLEIWYTMCKPDWSKPNKFSMYLDKRTADISVINKININTKPLSHTVLKTYPQLYKKTFVLWCIECTFISVAVFVDTLFTIVLMLSYGSVFPCWNTVTVLQHCLIPVSPLSGSSMTTVWFQCHHCLVPVDAAVIFPLILRSFTVIKVGIPFVLKEDIDVLMLVYGQCIVM